MKKGFTIVELLISLLLITIATVIAFDLILNSINLSNKIEKELSYTINTQNVLNQKFLDIPVEELTFFNITAEATIVEETTETTIIFKNQQIPALVQKISIQNIGDESANVPLFIFIPEEIYQQTD